MLVTAAVALLPGQVEARCCGNGVDCPRGFACMPGGGATGTSGTCDSTIINCACDAACAPTLCDLLAKLVSVAN